ncbi:MAG: hypothetical protein J0L82_15715 [Deltaproteobacteria bacterium]|jgi:hypothetical protein|nr:hypothetical protein [Deltaproteobacteria bacterium]
MFTRFKVIQLLLFLNLLATSVISASPVLAQPGASTCEAHRWPYSQNVSGIRIQDLEKANRTALYSYLYFELTKEPSGRIGGLAKKLMFFLKNTELNNDRALMLAAIETAAEFDSSSPTVFNIEELCLIDRKAASVKSSTRPSKKRK